MFCDATFLSAQYQDVILFQEKDVERIKSQLKNSYHSVDGS